MSLLKQIELQLANNLPFVAYRKPNESLVTSFLQKNDVLHYSNNLVEIGFIFAPFNSSQKTVIIPLDESKKITETLSVTQDFEEKNQFFNDESNKKFHIKLVEQAVQEIEKGTFKKVVVSRKEKIQLADFDFILSFKKLLKRYKNAFVYVWFHPEVGFWMGATPETLLKTRGSKFETMALAGTQIYKENMPIVWKEKEIKEQQYVTDFIINNIKDNIDSLNVFERETVKAGNLLHLRTKISGQLKDNLNIINKLHPTPAVCGLPKEASKSFILENENYDRDFYTGFLGELNLNEESNLFVNLRCMKIEKSVAHIYVGGGITIESNPEKEWFETVQKTYTMKKVL